MTQHNQAPQLPQGEHQPTGNLDTLNTMLDGSNTAPKYNVSNDAPAEAGAVAETGRHSAPDNAPAPEWAAAPESHTSHAAPEKWVEVDASQPKPQPKRTVRQRVQDWADERTKNRELDRTTGYGDERPAIDVTQLNRDKAANAVYKQEVTADDVKGVEGANVFVGKTKQEIRDLVAHAGPDSEAWTNLSAQQRMAAEKLCDQAAASYLATRYPSESQAAPAKSAPAATHRAKKPEAAPTAEAPAARRVTEDESNGYDIFKGKTDQDILNMGSTFDVMSGGEQQTWRRLEQAARRREAVARTAETAQKLGVQEHRVATGGIRGLVDKLTGRDAVSAIKVQPENPSPANQTPVTNVDTGSRRGRRTRAVEGAEAANTVAIDTSDVSTLRNDPKTDTARVMTEADRTALFDQEDGVQPTAKAETADDAQRMTVEDFEEMMAAGPEKAKKSLKERATEVAGKVGDFIMANGGSLAVETAKKGKSKAELAVLNAYGHLPRIDGERIKREYTYVDAETGETKLTTRGKILAGIAGTTGVLAVATAVLGAKVGIDLLSSHADTANQATQLGGAHGAGSAAHHAVTTTTDLNQGHSPNTGADFHSGATATDTAPATHAATGTSGIEANHAHNTDVGSAHNTTYAGDTDLNQGHSPNTGADAHIPQQRTSSSTNPADQSQATGNGHGPDGRPSAGNQHPTTGGTNGAEQQQFDTQPQHLNAGGSVWESSSDYLHAHGLQGSNEQIAALTNWRLGQMGITPDQARFLQVGQPLPMPLNTQMLDEILKIKR